MISTAVDMQKAIVKIFRENRTSLFAGAGVSARAQVPAWGSYLEHLACVAQQYEPLLAQLMRKRISAGLLLEAAHYYKTSCEIPEGEKLRELVSPFDDDKLLSRHLDRLCTLPFRLAITTNYDRSLLHSFARVHSLAPRQAELRDPTLKESLYWKDFYIARIHGRSEVPRSIVLDSADYECLYADPDYQDFVRSALVRHSLLFIGFSFLDPAINHILEFIRRVGVQPSLHHALVPAGNDGLRERMAAFNIKVIEYDPAGGHAILWEGIELASLELCRLPGVSAAEPTSSFDTAKRLLATCYARASMGKEVEALRLVVVEGIIISEIAGGISSVQDLRTRLRSYMALTETEVETIIDANVDHLVLKGICLRDGDSIVLVNDIALDTSPAAILVEGVISRAMIRDKLVVSDQVRAALTCVIEEVIVLRGFDLGAEFSGANIGEEPDISSTFTASINRHLPTEWQDKKHLLCEAFTDLIRHPARKEETVLGELGRLAFGIEILLQSGRAAVYGFTLPHIIYLDSNVLMPAIVQGHPKHTAYGSAIRRLQEAASQSGGSFAVHISDVILNEIVSHRRKAIEMVRDARLGDVETLERRILYYGAGNVNVYVGGFAGWVREAGNSGKTFNDFLSIVAPYQSERELRRFLTDSGITVTNTAFPDAREIVDQEQIVDFLYEGYASQEKGLDFDDRKIDVLKKHEAAQLYLLKRDIDAARRPIFVTADAKLRRAVADSPLSRLRDSLMSPQNLVQLVDLVIGIDVPPASLARLLWSVKMADDRAVIKDYLVHRAMPHYDAALLLKLNDVLDSYTDKVLREAQLEAIQITPFSYEDRQSTSRFMDRVEDELFASLADEVQKLKVRLRNAGLE